MIPPDLASAPGRFLRHNLGLKALALALAILAWWFVAGESKVMIGFNVPLEIRDIPRDMILTNKVERQVEVRLSGPSSLLAAFRPSDVTVTLDLSAGKPGKQTVPLDVRTVRVPPGIRVERIFPESVEVVMERTERRLIPVSVRLKGGKSASRLVQDVQIDPPKVLVEAPPEEIARMPVVYTEELDPDPAVGTFTTIATVEPRGAHARIVGNPNVRVQIQFRK